MQPNEFFNFFIRITKKCRFIYQVPQVSEPRFSSVSHDTFVCARTKYFQYINSYARQLPSRSRKIKMKWFWDLENFFPTPAFERTKCFIYRMQRKNSGFNFVPNLDRKTVRLIKKWLPLWLDLIWGARNGVFRDRSKKHHQKSRKASVQVGIVEKYGCRRLGGRLDKIENSFFNGWKPDKIEAT